MNRKGYFILVLIFANTLGLLYGQNARYILDESNPNFYTQKNALNLIKYKKYVLTENCNDFRLCDCSDSIAKKYSFIRKYFPNYGSCLVLSKNVNDSIKHFNQIMQDSLLILNGKDWQIQYKQEVNECANKICCRTEHLDSFYLHEQFNNGVLFNLNDFKLQKETKCVLNNILVKTLKKYTNLKITLNGYSTSDENDNNLVLSKNRALEVQKYLVSQGIPKNRISIKAIGYERENSNTDYKDKKNLIRKNRKVVIQVSGI